MILGNSSPYKDKGENLMADGFMILNQVLFGEAVKNVLAFSNMAYSPDDVKEWADNFRGDWDNELTQYLSTSWSMDTLTFVFNPGPNQFSVEQDFSLGTLTGTVSTDALPNQTSLLVSTQYVGPRPNRGRVYFAGLGENNLTQGLFTVAAVTAFENAVDKWASIGVNGAAGTIFLRIARRAANGSILTSNPVDVAIGREIPATQRRRRRAG